MQPQQSQYPQQMPPQPYPYVYPAAPVMVAPPQRQYAVPEGRRVPTIWAISLVTVAAVASLLALGGGLLRPLAPAPYRGTVYASPLTQDDGAWQLASDPSNQCAFANGSLDAVTTTAATTFTSSCNLSNHIVSDFRLSVRLLPPADATNTFYASLFVRSTTTTGVAFIVSNSGLIRAEIPDHSTAVLTLSADQWHTNTPDGNVFVILAQGSTYTLAMNGVEVYQGDLNGYAEIQASSGSIGVGAVPLVSGSTEARFTDFSLTAP